MKKNKKRIIILLLIIIIIIYLISIILRNNKIFNDDLIFFKSFNLSNSENSDNTLNSKKIKESNYIISKENTNNNDEIFFKVKYKGTELKNINISDTINKNTLVNEKIAPGTAGEFQIIMTSNENINYKIMFESKNEKPTNMNFYIKGENKKYSTLEDLQEKLTGKLKKDEIVKINIRWEWNYTNNNDYQDTLDGIKLKEYNFNIYTKGF